MSKSASSRAFFPAVWIVGVVLVAAAAMVAASPAKSGRHSGDRAATSPSSKPQATAAARSRLNAAYAALPLAFEPNQGQTDTQVKYMARGAGYKLYLTSSQAIFKVHKRGADSEVRRMMMDRRLGPAKVRAMRRRRAASNARDSVASVRMNLLGANPQAQLLAGTPQAGKVNYFIGNDPSKWHSGIPLFGQVTYRNLYPGVDLAFHGNGQQLEFDYLVSPGADAKSIALGFQGAERFNTNAAGDLVLTTTAGPIEIHRPVAYQEKDGARQIVEARFVVKSGNRVSFALGAYDHSRELVIDPTVTYSTYFGGDFADYGIAIAVDGSGNEFVAGATNSDSLPGYSNPTLNETYDVYVTEINSAGVLQFTTEFGGATGDDFAGGIALDSTGIYVAGTTSSSDFPVTAGVVQSTFEGGASNGNNDAFAAKLTLAGLLGPTVPGTWATYIAGSDSDSGLAVAVDSSQNVYVVGETFSSDLGSPTQGTPADINPLPNGQYINLNQGTGDDDGYIVKLNSTATAYSTVSYIGGSSGDLATGVALDGSGNIYVSGQTISADLPTTAGVVQPTCGTDGMCNASGGNLYDDAFVAAIPAGLSAYTYLTYYGGSSYDDGLAISVDSAGNAFFTGLTQSTDFPTAGTPYQSALAAGATQNAFVVELNPTGTAATYGTYLGGNGVDLGLGIALDSSDNAYVTGQTSSNNFPQVNPTQSGFGGSTDAFVTVLSPAQKTALFSTYLGGGGDEDQLAGAIALGSSQNIYVTGDTDSATPTPFPTVNALDGTYGGGTCTDSNNNSVPCPNAFIAAYTKATAPDFSLTATTPAAVNPGSSGTSTVTLTALNGYSSGVNLTCSVSGTGSPAPTCSFSSASVTPIAVPGATSTLTIDTTGASAAMFAPRKFLYAMWLPIAGLSLMGMGFSSGRSRGKKLLGFLMIGMVMAALFLMPACGGSSSKGGGGGGCAGCTPAGNYTVTITGTGTDTAATTNSTTVTLTVN